MTVTFTDWITEIANWVFLAIALATLAGAFLVVTAKNVVRAVLALVVTFAGTCALLSLLFRPAPDPKRLVAFYEKVRPIGAWGPVRALASTGPPRGEGTTTIIGVVSGLALTYSLLFGIGFMILDRQNALVFAILIAAVSSVGVVHACRRLASATSEETT